MTVRRKRPAWVRAILLATAAAALAGGVVSPALADYRRSCRAVLEVRQAGTNNTIESYQWRVYNTVTWYAQVNDARREARRAIVTCMQTHWEARDAAEAPYACQTHGSLEFGGYPFADLAGQLRDDLCTEGGEIRLDLDLVLFIDGETGCVVDGGNINPATRVDIASGYRVNCPIPEGGGSECAGDDCPGAEPSGGDGGSAGVMPDRPPLPGIRLPGHDIGGVWTPGEDWTTCWQMCQDNPTCGAWTWRAEGTSGPGSTAGCLLKSEAGVQVPDSCCHSGIKE